MAKKQEKIPVLTGAAIPLGALYSAESCGVGEFLDLIPYADFCKKSGFGIIQLLPVNDTGTESSPYSALSAFALHPLYIRLQQIPESKKYSKEIDALAKKHTKNKRFLYKELRQEKIKLLRSMYDSNSKKIVSSAELQNWIKQNPWIIAYAVFMELKRVNNEASWKEWKNRYTKKQIEAAWKDEKLKENHLFFAWTQMHLHEQFLQAALYIRSLGILLKGDIPILMNEDSCDIWAHPDYFSDDFRAGSPVDPPNPLGQNWGFPVYRWDNLQKDDYSWWKERLVQASKYYDAYRIDHILGFFRIWATPQSDFSAVLGHTEPYEPISAEELNAIGFSADRIRWLSQPHVKTETIQWINGGNYEETHGQLSLVMNRIGNEELWLFKPEITGEKIINAQNLPDSVKNALCEQWRNRTLLEITKNNFVPIWTYRDTTAWHSLNEQEKRILDELIQKKQKYMELLWKEQALTILGELTKSTKMIACGEDLGANFEAVPEVLETLSILALRIIRWTRHWEKQGFPFTALNEYPVLSVASTSVHDSSTIRGWWLLENDSNDFMQAFPAPKEIRLGEFTPKTAEYILSIAAKTASSFCIHSLQDFLYLDSAYYDNDPNNERINTPGTVNETNWTYRIPVSIEELQKNETLCKKIQAIVALKTQ